LQLYQMRRFRAARLTPRRIEIKHHNFSFVISKCRALFVIKRPAASLNRHGQLPGAAGKNEYRPERQHHQRQIELEFSIHSWRSTTLHQSRYSLRRCAAALRSRLSQSSVPVPGTLRSPSARSRSAYSVRNKRAATDCPSTRPACHTLDRFAQGKSKKEQGKSKDGERRPTASGGALALFLNQAALHGVE
jgi:hypothetical protein